MKRRNQVRRKKSSILSFRKGNVVIEVIFVLIALLVFVITFMFGKYIFSEVNTDFQADTNLANESKAEMSTMNTRYTSVFDGLFLLALILLWALLLVGAYFLDSNPVLFIIMIIVLIFVFFLGATMGNVYEEVAGDSDLATISTQFPITNGLMSNMVIMVIVMGFSVVIVLFGKSRT